MNKVKKIVAEEFDVRMGNAVVAYLLDKGVDNIAQVTDEQIEELEGNGLMTKEFVQGLVRAARRVAMECSQDDIFKYIQTEFYFGNSGNIDLYRDDIANNSTWEEICDCVGVEYETEEIHGMIIREED